MITTHRPGVPRIGKAALALLAGVLVVAAAVPSARAAGLTRVVGRLVEAEFVSTEACLVTTTHVFAVDDSTGAAAAYAQYVREDVCTGALLGYAAAGRPLEPGELTIDASVRRATLRAALAGTRHDGSPVTLDLALDWDASERPFLYLAGSHVRSPGSTFGAHGVNRFYGSDVIGSVLDGTTDLAAGASRWGRVGLESSGTLTLEAGLLSGASPTAGTFDSVVQELDHVAFAEAGASFSVADPSGCRFSQIFLSATDGTRQTPGGPAQPESLLAVSAFSVDNCLGVVVLDGHVERPLQPGELSVAGNLASGRLVGSITLPDRVSGGPISLLFEVTWTAEGGATTTIAHDVQTPPFASHHTIMTYQPATARGVFPGFLEGVTQGAALSHIRSSEVSLSP